jgi:uncharacterized membrane protein
MKNLLDLLTMGHSFEAVRESESEYRFISKGWMSNVLAEKKSRFSYNENLPNEVNYQADVVPLVPKRVGRWDLPNRSLTTDQNSGTSNFEQSTVQESKFSAITVVRNDLRTSDCKVILGRPLEKEKSTPVQSGARLDKSQNAITKWSSLAIKLFMVSKSLI